MWTWLVDPIYGFGVGIEFVPNEEGETEAWIIDILFVRFIYLKL